VEASANVSEKKMLKVLLGMLLGEESQVELIVGDGQFESGRVFEALQAKRQNSIII